MRLSLNHQIHSRQRLATRDGKLKKIATLLLLLLSSLAFAEPPHWMKKENPKELAVDLTLSPNCGIERDWFEQLLMVAFINGKMTPSNVNNETELVLSVTLQCHSASVDDDVILWMGQIDFLGRSDIDGIRTWYRHGLGGHSMLAATPKDEIMKGMQESIEQNLRQYRKANSISVPMDDRLDELFNTDLNQ